MALRPTVVIGADRFAVVDVSEQGLRFVADVGAPPVGTAVLGRLLLPEHPPFEIEGMVIRRDHRYVALALTRGVPFGVILDQQRLLQQRIWV